MKKLCTVIGTIYLLLTFPLMAQHLTSKQEAYAKGQSARASYQAGNIEEAFAFLNQAIKLDKDNIAYPYELAYIYFQEKDYKHSLSLSKKLFSHHEVDDQVYKLAIRSCIEAGDPSQALKLVQKGLDIFKESASLAMEMGLLLELKGEKKAALEWFEKGISFDANVAGNYYHAWKLLNVTSESLFANWWYAESFLTLERETERADSVRKDYSRHFEKYMDFYKSKHQNAVKMAQGLQEKRYTALGIQEYFEIQGASCTIPEEGVIRDRYRLILCILDNSAFAEMPEIPLLRWWKFLKDSNKLKYYLYWICDAPSNPKYSDEMLEIQTEYNSFIYWYRNQKTSLKGEISMDRNFMLPLTYEK